MAGTHFIITMKFPVTFSNCAACLCRKAFFPDAPALLIARQESTGAMMHVNNQNRQRSTAHSRAMDGRS